MPVGRLRHRLRRSTRCRPSRSTPSTTCSSRSTATASARRSSARGRPSRAGRRATRRAAGALLERAAAPSRGTCERLLVKRRAGRVLVQVEEIDWIESAGNYVRLHVGRERHLLRETMTALEDELDPAQFVRIHRSTIVNLDRVRELEPYFHGDYVVRLHGRHPAHPEPHLPRPAAGAARPGDLSGAAGWRRARRWLDPRRPRLPRASATTSWSPRAGPRPFADSLWPRARELLDLGRLHPGDSPPRAALPDPAARRLAVARSSMSASASRFAAARRRRSTPRLGAVLRPRPVRTRSAEYFVANSFINVFSYFAVVAVGHALQYHALYVSAASPPPGSRPSSSAPSSTRSRCSSGRTSCSTRCTPSPRWCAPDRNRRRGADDRRAQRPAARRRCDATAPAEVPLREELALRRALPGDRADPLPGPAATRGSTPSPTRSTRWCPR